jgi:ribosome recycling factor
VNVSELADVVLEDANDKMDKAVSHARSEFATIRTGRASSAIVEKLTVEAYGAEMKLQDIASFSIGNDVRQLVVSPHDPGTLGAIEKAIRNADVGAAPSNDGRSIRLNFPPPTEQRRKELTRVVDKMAEEGKVAIRNVRRHSRKELEDLKKNGDLTENDLTRAEKELDRLTHLHEGHVEGARAKKVEELLEV